jgi:hypothetical protein
VKYAILAVFIRAALLTPSPDIWNQIAFAAPMLALYVVGIGVAFLAAPAEPPQSANAHLRLVFAAGVIERARRGSRGTRWRGRVVG